MFGSCGSRSVPRICVADRSVAWEHWGTCANRLRSHRFIGIWFVFWTTGRIDCATRLVLEVPTIFRFQPDSRLNFLISED